MSDDQGGGGHAQTLTCIAGNSFMVDMLQNEPAAMIGVVGGGIQTTLRMSAEGLRGLASVLRQVAQQIDEREVGKKTPLLGKFGGDS